MGGSVISGAAEMMGKGGTSLLFISYLLLLYLYVRVFFAILFYLLPILSSCGSSFSVAQSTY